MTIRPVFALSGAARLGLVAAFVAALFVLPNLELRAMPVPAVAWSVALNQADMSPASVGEWESEPIEARVTLVGMSWEGRAPEAAWVRTDDGSGWSQWLPLAIDAEHGPDPGSAEEAIARPASEPLYVGEVERIQYRVEAPTAAGIEAELVETSARSLGFGERLSRLVRRITWSTPAVDAAPDQPTILPREAWGGDACTAGVEQEPEYTDGVRMMVVHHTATSNTYAQSEAVDAIYAICAYHVQSRGWNDIGYNFVIDRFGTIYEGRAGGIDQAVRGAHTGGFNYYSTGATILGNFDLVAPSQASLDALVELTAWKLDLAHVDPTATVELVSLGSSRFAEGEVVTLPTVAGHRDASTTSGPGKYLYPMLGDLRAQVLDLGGAKIFGGGPSVVPPPLDQPSRFPFSFTEPMAWDFSLTSPSGVRVVEESGSGMSGEVLWDGTVGGLPGERGEYAVSLVATTLDDGEAPRPVGDTLTWFNPPFADDDFNIHEPNINAIAAAGITQGCSDIFAWRFCPDHSVPRDQMASFIARALDLPPATQDYFTDDDGNTHEAAINSLAEAGIAKGCDEERYCPSGRISRGQMATFLFRAMGLDEVDEDRFTDDTGSVHEASINAVAAAGVTFGCDDGTTFCPKDSVSRAQMASFLARAFLNGEN